MKTRCRSVQRRLQDYLDRMAGGSAPDGGLSGFNTPDVEHIRTCERCRKLSSRYPSIRAALRSEAGAALAQMPAPDWEKILSEGRQRAVHEETRAGHSSPRHGIFAVPRRIALPAAALLLVFIGAGGLVGYHQYRVSQARAFVRSDTSAFVDSLFSAPFFSAASQSTVPLGVDSSWFEVASGPASLPPASAPASGQGGAAPSSNP